MIKEHRYRIHSFLLLAAFCFSATLLGQPKGLQHGGVAAIILTQLLYKRLSKSDEKEKTVDIIEENEVKKVIE